MGGDQRVKSPPTLDKLFNISYDKNMNKLDRLIKISVIIGKLELKVEQYGQLYAEAEMNGESEKANEYYLVRKYAREGLKLARIEFAKTQREYRRIKIIV